MIRPDRLRIPAVSASFLIFTVLITFSAFFGATSAAADEPSDDPQHLHDPENVWNIVRGGRLYDNWMAELLHDLPKGNHPVYPETGRKQGFPTWRCKECHGWDYKGVEGEYRKGSNHYTGIKGVKGVFGKKFQEIIKILMNENHGFTEQQLPHAAQELLAIFLSKGQMDMDRYIDADNKKARGDIKRGGQMYQTMCVMCHGFDGKEINFKSDKYPSYIGTISNRNPWETLHKINFGQPGVGMMALANQNIEVSVDILAYCQTLPVK